MPIWTALMGWKGYAAVALAGGLILGGAAWTAQGWRWDAKLARAETAWAQEHEAQAQAAMTAIEAARDEGRRRTAAMEKARDDAQNQAAAAAADAAGLRAEHDRLRARVNALAHAAAARDPGAAEGSPAGTDAVDLLAYMLGRVSRRAEELAGIADRARIAGLTCERAYEVLRAR
ncbi:DUF2514 family protein [Achromobacter veterisilvae]|uniref:DUF2514 family protein n=1 Tax=Achromobacter veterisilvae TaxID=2069367 RepID=UPI001FC9E7FD|nr:DUF2514 family protein [Achromobacter veterisilvae]